MSKKTQSVTKLQTLKTQDEMTVISPSEETILAQNLELRNENVEKAYLNIVKGTKELLTAFETLKYRISVTVDHTKSGKETNLINEWLCFFYNFTLTKNRFGYKMIYVSYDEDALTRFGDKLFNRMLRIVFKCTNLESSDINIENCIRIDHSATDIQPFFINRLFNQEKDYVTVTTEERVPS